MNNYNNYNNYNQFSNYNNMNGIYCQSCQMVLASRYLFAIAMRSVIQQRGFCKSQITRAHNNALKFVDDIQSVDTIVVRLSQIQDNYLRFVRHSEELYAFQSESDWENPDDDFDAYEEKHYATHAILSNTLEELRRDQTSNNILATVQPADAPQRSHVDFQFERIKLPTFSGNYEDWKHFSDMFTDSIASNSSLTDCQRFHYLKSYLSGDALNLVKHIPVTNENYREAWDRLEQRYNKQSLIIRSFLNSFMTLPSATSTNLSTVRKLADGADEVIRGLRALDCEERDPWLIFILLSKLDTDTCQAWAQCADSEGKGVTINQFLKFLTSRCDTLEAFHLVRPTQARRAATTHHADTHPRREEPKCTSCQQTHQLFKCPQFNGLDIAARREFLKTKKLCFNCLSPSHMAGNCTSRHTCRICRRKHHTLVHPGSAQPTQNGNYLERAASTIGQNQPPGQEIHQSGSLPPAENNFTHHTLENISAAGSQTLLPTILADVVDAWGNTTTCRLLLDTGSTITLASESFVQRIGVRRTHARISVLGLAANSAGVTRGRAHIKLRSRHSDQTVELVSFILNSLTSSLPAQAIDTSSSTWKQICELPLADPTFCTPGSIDVIVGSDQLWSLYTGEQKCFGNDAPIALNTVFGWIIAGSYNACDDYLTSAVTHHADLDTMVRSFMEMDNIHPSQALLDANDPTERHFAATHTRLENGAYVVEYPFKEHAPPVDSTLPQAINRFHSLERKFRRSPDLKQQYEAFLDDYLRRGHMEQLTSAQMDESPETCFYLPHHAVIKLDSLTTKCRVVFDGSGKDSSGVSLNDRLQIGPPIQRDLLGVCLRFRQHPYVFCADIEKMFRGIQVFKPHTNYQRIVWRKNENEPLLHFRLLTVTYGLAPSPFLAVRVLKQLAEDHRHEFPAAAHALLHDAYVDDIPTGCNSFDELMILKNELIQLLDKAQFKLRKWSSNSWRLLKSLPEEDRCYEPIQLLNKSAADSPIKILGIQWNPGKDVMYLNIKECDPTISPTKRELLSQLSRIYDPLGLVAPVTVLFKLIFQESWTSVLQWDDPIPETLRSRWKALVEDLPTRNVKYHDTLRHHSKTFNYTDSPTHPRKPTVRFTSCWTDSEIVLHWLSAPPRNWNTYVCNRTAEILNDFPRSCWNHVRTEDNPADCASRGLHPSKLLEHRLWWKGPSWLATPPSDWPPSTSKFSVSSNLDVNTEERAVKPTTLHNFPDESIYELLIHKFSTWTRLLRVSSYCYRFIHSLRSRHRNPAPFLTSEELQAARCRLIRHVQQNFFAREYAQLENRRPLNAKSHLIRFSPFLDDHGIMRVGGRIDKSTINFNAKHPILIPKDSPLAGLLVRHFHVSHLHTGVDATFTNLRQQYWILGARNLVRKAVFQCKRCFLQRKGTSNQIMGELPIPRVQASRCFQHTGLDYAGPIAIKESTGRTPRIGKAWFSIFVCLTTKAIHIEVVSDLTAKAFIAAFQRFIARRTKPTDLYSDNGTTFHGGKQTLDDMRRLVIEQSKDEELAGFFANEGISWHFIPPSAPHFGGMWEAGVRSIKLHMRRILGSKALTFEELATVLTQIEAILNSRPLCPNGDNSLDPLTPAHFLTGAPYTALSEPCRLDMQINRLERWNQLQAMVQGFWKRWHMEYLTSLHERTKWHLETENLKIDTLVVLKEPNLPPSKWILGRISEVHAGSDDKVRVVTVKTAHGFYKRPITKIAVLPLC
ncbi:uncharacterized protein [Drosophila kikkawai]|uniref:Integrase catalytic domain-containing protein n=1 Tax=Drosophila kikkawai TaxID=30033 RepID=A0ABM3C662_DROKI